MQFSFHWDLEERIILSKTIYNGMAPSMDRREYQWRKYYKLKDEIVFKHVMEMLLKPIVNIWVPERIHLVMLAV